MSAGAARRRQYQVREREAERLANLTWEELKVEPSTSNTWTQLKWKFDLSREEFFELFEFQHRRCAICRLEPERPCDCIVDHDHVTNTVRGLICTKCNIGLGMFCDSQDILRTAIGYLADPPYANWKARAKDRRR